MRIRQTVWTCVCILVVALAASYTAQGANWSNTIAAVVFNDKLYTIEKSGALYATNLTTGKWVQVGKSEFANTRLLFAGGSNLLTIEADGSLYRINPADGSWSRIGNAGDWRNTYFVGENLDPTVERVDRLKPVVPDDMTLPEMALRFVLSNPDVATVIPGMRKSRTVEANFTAAEKGALPQDLIARLRPHRWDRTPSEWSQ